MEGPTYPPPTPVPSPTASGPTSPTSFSSQQPSAARPTSITIVEPSIRNTDMPLNRRRRRRSPYPQPLPTIPLHAFLNSSFGSESSGYDNASFGLDSTHSASAAPCSENATAEGEVDITSHGGDGGGDSDNEASHHDAISTTPIAEESGDVIQAAVERLRASTSTSLSRMRRRRRPSRCYANVGRLESHTHHRDCMCECRLLGGGFPKTSHQSFYMTKRYERWLWRGFLCLITAPFWIPAWIAGFTRVGYRLRSGLHRFFGWT